MERKYYALWFRLDHKDLYAIWYSNDRDGVILDETGQIVVFQNLSNLHVHAVGAGFQIEAESPILHDLDVVHHWLAHARKTNVNCNEFLSAWNLFSDVLSSIDGVSAYIDQGKEGRIYNKLFWGSNIPAMTPPGKHYEPVWTKSEVGRLRNVLAAGLSLFRRHVSVEIPQLR